MQHVYSVYNIFSANSKLLLSAKKLLIDIDHHGNPSPHIWPKIEKGIYSFDVAYFFIYVHRQIQFYFYVEFDV